MSERIKPDVDKNRLYQFERYELGAEAKNGTIIEQDYDEKGPYVIVCYTRTRTGCGLCLVRGDCKIPEPLKTN